MKKFILFSMVIALVFVLPACNNPADDIPGGTPPEEVTITPNYLYVLGSDSSYPGAEISLAGNSLLDISNYNSVIVDATLYSDEEGETLAVQASSDDNLAQFTLLKHTGDWDVANNKCASTKYHMVIDGGTTLTVAPGDSGIPGVLLVQANWAEFPDAVKAIRVKSITFTPKTDDVTISPGGLYVVGNGTSYPGAEINLSEYGLLDISRYASVIVDAELYSDTEGETLTTASGSNLAQFTLLKHTGDWDVADNICAPTKYGMLVKGETVMTVPSGVSGVPGVLLLQANWVDFPNAVLSIRVHTITFVPKTSDVVLDFIFADDPDKTAVKVVGNKITFTNASYGSSSSTGNNWDGVTGYAHAALYIFDESFFPLEGKSTLTFNYSLEDYETTAIVGGQQIALEHQIHIQAAQDTTEKDMYNGWNPSSSNNNVGQVYITLEDTMDANGAGSFTVSVPALIAASQVTSSTDAKAPFTLDAVRIVNNGTRWTNTGVSPQTVHTRAKTYTLVIESVTIR